MNFLALITGVLLLQYRGPLEAAAPAAGFARLQALINGRLGAPVWRLALALLVPVLLCLWFFDLLRPLLFGLPWIVLAGLSLWWSCGQLDVGALVRRYRGRCEAEDVEGAFLVLEDALPASGEAAPVSPAGFYRQAQERLLYAAYQRWFPPVLYFVLLGPAGALAYRLAVMAAADVSDHHAQRLLAWLDWVPARLLAMTFALTGDFVGSRRALGRVLSAELAAAQVLQTVAEAAVPATRVEADSGAQASAAAGDQSALLSRSAASWLVLAALLTLAA